MRRLQSFVMADVVEFKFGFDVAAICLLEVVGVTHGVVDPFHGTHNMHVQT